MTHDPATPVENIQGDWMAVVRGRREVRRCKRGKHERVMTAFHGRPIARCHCGATELDRDGLWIYTHRPVGRRSTKDVAEHVAIHEMFKLSLARQV